MVKNFDDFEKQMNEGFVDWLTGKNKEQKDLSPEVSSYYAELEEFANSGKAIPVQTKGQMQYSDLVRKIQLALDFLGYKMPKYGVDGLFGPETAGAIANFNSATASQNLTESLIDFKTFTVESINGRLPNSSLTPIRDASGSATKHKLNPTAAADYEKMRQAAEAEGVTWTLNDSYRDYETQVKVAAAKGLYSQGGAAAAPGTSNHGLGSAVDINVKNNRKARRWLETNAQKYGFTSVANEPWHWEHKASASLMKQTQPTNAEIPTLTLIDGDLVRRLIINLKNRGFSDQHLSQYNQQVQTEIDPAASTSDDAFYKEILRQLGTEATPEKMKFLKAWRQAEGGEFAFNPFNTSKKLKVSGIRVGNSHGVKEYPNAETGITATVHTLKLPYYKNLLKLLQTNTVTADQLASCPDLNKWGTKDGVKKVLAGGRINPPAISTT